MVLGLLIGLVAEVCAQDTLALPVPKARAHREGGQSAYPKNDSTYMVGIEDELSDSLLAVNIADSILSKDSVHVISLLKDSVDISAIYSLKERWVPNPKKAMWLAIVFPGGGQIYNKKYWKLPIIYGGFIGCIYALNWNNTMYRDYSQAYIDIMDDDPNTKSYENFIPPSYNVDQNLTRIQDLFRRKKNYYRRYRDLSIFCMIGVYALSIIDAYVDAELSSFDISHDLSMKVKPTIINNAEGGKKNNLMSNSYGLQCSLRF
ncbi:MAG: DUF5683 domain-containing protein [Bacteroides sp.]|nr:DUF5683 domain-containing protein [Bacteroides sp.]